MNEYLNYIEESTNTVKSRARLSKLLLILSCLVIWALNIAAEWLFSAGSITEAQAGGFQWLVLPLTTVVISLLIGRNDYWGKRKWLGVLVFGIMFSLSVYAGSGMRENSPFGQINLQTLSFVFIGAAASAFGMAIGHGFFAEERRRQGRE